MPEIEPSLRALVRAWANGLCEYCHISEQATLAPHQIDHIMAVKHGGRTIALNLALCCSLCNRYKGSDIASRDSENGELTPLFHPRMDEWDRHFELRDGEIKGLTAEGRATVRLLRINRPARIQERRLMRR